MKNLFKIFLIISTTCLFLFSLYSWQMYDIQAKLLPYNIAVDEINQELDTRFVVPKGKEFEVYHNIMDITPKELAQSIKEQFLNIEKKDAPPTIHETSTSQSIIPNYDTESWKNDY